MLVEINAGLLKQLIEDDWKNENNKNFHLDTLNYLKLPEQLDQEWLDFFYLVKQKEGN